MSQRDYYEVLGIPRDASEEVIKKAYRKTALKYHPDRNQDNKAAEERFKEAAAAYEVLGNPKKKARYDQYGHAGARSDPQGGRPMNMEDIFSQFGDIFGSGGFGDFFGRGGGGRRGTPQQGNDLRIKIRLTLKEIALGTEKKIKVKRMVVDSRVTFGDCPQCQGNGEVRRRVNTMLGQMVSSSSCGHCGGRGVVIDYRPPGVEPSGLREQEEVLDIKIPPGVSEGVQLSMREKGNDPPGGGIAGNLLIVLEEIKDKIFQREGQHIIYNLPLSFPEATLGKEVNVPCIDGVVSIKVKPGTQGGATLRLRGKGIPSLENKRIRGDQLVRVHVWVPTKLNEAERSLLGKLSACENIQPDPSGRDASFYEKVKNVFSRTVG